MYGSGQVTLPKRWRERFRTNTFVAEIGENELVIRPLLIDEVDRAALLTRNPSFDFLKAEPDLYE
ncbi:MAG: AbrB/MazE/SpoVT family DNA-binding domain-containing protein [Armatimonadetes bacterium]|jgi:bifunctional DNA-binding transcriptional regulator/antitoxin component of YhaV-PrlF toxin-antitoxin module|nr:AbrB/MazE/SpoVT family DNA-binding domain-containing protein [Armatimonadota bacterium]NCO92003.1 AbrB/MazE/SpoVT family DNA-binding domain-containing protein [Armatimonadota bacterium]NCP33292.1 AbrB/MazE/SpoVT family DNA-binding domain-containing protein [Armatimonadota bacterium]NCQ30631.1 AbrB/MazE/SpoVT family DNA-binding domain-containing protein [Armatimonadota bacterium]NDK14017.1 AbrB/MazE/SpoVT family DNA-binding domain-containing protein [Armatimonadota bacterium]